MELLIERAKDRGCWFLGGLEKTLLLIEEELPANDHKVRSLIGNLMA